MLPWREHIKKNTENSFRLEHDYDYKHLNFSLASCAMKFYEFTPPTVTVAVDKKKEVKYIASTHHGRNIVMIEFSTFRAREIRYYDASCSKHCDKFIKFTVILINITCETVSTQTPLISV